MNPYIYVAVTVVSVFATYYLTHMNNFKVLREKWIKELRDASCDIIEAYERLYYARDWQWELAASVNATDEAKNRAIRNSEDAQAHALAAWTKLRLLFKEGDKDYEAVKPKLDVLHNSADSAEMIEGRLRMNPATRKKAQDEYIKEINVLLHRHWNEISKSPFQTIKDYMVGIFCKSCPHKKELSN